MIDMQQAMTAQIFFHASLRNADGSAVRARRNGVTKTWKRNPSRFQVPVKYGLKVCFYITPENAQDWLAQDPTIREENNTCPN